MGIFKFPPDEYGFTTDASNETVLAERQIFCEAHNIHPRFPMSDLEHIEFEIYLSRKYREEFIEYLLQFGGLNNTYRLIEAKNGKSFLLRYYINRRAESDTNEKATVSVRYIKACRNV